MQEPFIESSWTKPDAPFENPLRPQILGDFIGQESIRSRLEIFIEAAKSRKEALGHCLFSGPPGLGKTTLAHIIAKAMGTHLTVTSGPTIEKPGDLAGVLTNLKIGDVLFIDEIHRMPKIVEEYLYSAMEDFSLDLLIDAGPNARSVQVKLNPFTLVGATTRSGLLSSPMRSRFLISLRLDYYEPATLQKIVKRSSHILQLKLTDDAAFEIGKRSRGTPRIANNLLRWVRDCAQIQKQKVVDDKLNPEGLKNRKLDKDAAQTFCPERGNVFKNTTRNENEKSEPKPTTPGVPEQRFVVWGKEQSKNDFLVTRDFARKALEMLAIDELGLDEMDKKILTVMIDHHDGGPVGLNNLAASCGEESHTIEEVYEPFLVLQGLIKRSPRGRMATTAAYEHLGRKSKKIPE